jgi:hypothetical protein
MSTPYGQSTVIEGIDQAIQSIEEQIRSQQIAPGQIPPGEEQERRDQNGAVGSVLPPVPVQAPAPAPQAPGAAYPGAYAPTPPQSQPAPRQSAPAGTAQGVLESASLDELTLFVSRLRQIRDWLQQDSRLLPVVDEFIGQQVAASEKRNTRRNVTIASITTVVGAVLGWLLSSLATPSGLLSQVSQLFGR